MLAHLEALPLADRQAHWQAMLAARLDSNDLIQAMAPIDPLGPQPTVQPVQFATVADIRKIMANVRWNWPGWIPVSRVVGLASLEGVGKTRLAMDLNRRVYHELPWPDGQKMTLPKGSRSLWICADGQHDEIADMLPDFGLPDDAVIFPSLPDDPYGNTSLDDPDTLAAIDSAILAHKPWAAFIDSLTYATVRDLCEQRSIAILKQPFVDLVQKHQINLFLLLHVSASGQALGKRIKGITRTLLHLECPDSDKPERLRFWVEKSYGKKPPALGVTMKDGGNDYDFNPPAKIDRHPGGRPPVKREKAKQSVREELTRQNDQIGNDVVARLQNSDLSPDTIWRAIRDMSDAGELTLDGGKGTGRQTILHLN
jgi:hypothetical protein